MHRGHFKDASGSIAAGGTAQTALAENRDRDYLLVQNVSSGDLFVDFDGTAAVADQPSVKIAAGAAFVWETRFVPTGAVSIIGATTGQKFTIKEA